MEKLRSGRYYKLVDCKHLARNSLPNKLNLRSSLRRHCFFFRQIRSLKHKLRNTNSLTLSRNNRGAYLNATGTLATTAKQTLTLGDANSGELILQSRGATVFKNPTAGANQSLFIGEGAGASITGLASVGVGYQALNANTSGVTTPLWATKPSSQISQGAQHRPGLPGPRLKHRRELQHRLGHPSPRFTTGSSNTAVGYEALYSNSSGGFNTALGYQGRLCRRGGTTSFANTTGSNNTFLGYNSGPFSATQRNNMTAIGAFSVVDQANSLVLGGTAFYAVNVGYRYRNPVSST